MSPPRRSAGRSPYQRLRDRALFAGPLLLFLIIGIALVGDLSAQWWVLALPFALLVGPVLAVLRVADRHPRDGRDTTPWGQ